MLRRIHCVLLIAIALIPVARSRAWGDAGAANFDKLVNQLDDPAFLARSAAATALISAGSRFDSAVATQVEQALGRGLQHTSLEVRIAVTEIHREIEQARLDRQLACLLNPHCKADSLSLPGWSGFMRLAGADMASRRLYASLYDRSPRTLRDLGNGLSGKSAARLISRLDPYRLPPQDVVGWSLLLVLDIEGPHVAVPHLTSRLGLALGNSAMGPNTNHHVVRRLIDRWVRTHAGDCPVRERLLIAMRYGCHDLAAELCEQTFSDPTASPSALVTALLSACTLGCSDLETHVRGRLHDSRTAHVWQLIASRKTKIRTQVRDVALALLLHQHGIDPRTAGFEELQADPLVLYRDHSLGFPNEVSRQASFARAKQLIAFRNAQ